ncbi:MAG: terminase family protein [bacterium]|nr:terminase family protein [bacterium]
MKQIYDTSKPWKSLDPWQKKLLEAEGNIVVRSGRQSGKSTAIAIKTGDYAVNNRKSQILVISAVERQAYLLFEKILTYIEDKYPTMIKGGRERPTKSQIRLKNGAVIRCLPTGLTGRGIRGFNLLIADEAAFIPENVWSAVTPMIAITEGQIILLSTPFGRSGYFYRCFKDDSFEKFHVSSEDCPRMQSEISKEFLKQEKNRMTKLQYAQEYLGEFVDELRQLFSDDLIKRCMNVKRVDRIPKNNTFLGVDIARMGEDESTFEVFEKVNKRELRQLDNIITKKTLITDTIKQILMMEDQYNFKKIYIDDGGLGVGVFDHLLQEDKTKRKVIAINNASRSIDNEEKRKKKLLKEDLYNNLLRLMERGEIKLLDDDEIFMSLKSIQYEYIDGGMRIFGNYTHIAEGIIRAAWCVRDKSLNIYIS